MPRDHRAKAFENTSFLAGEISPHRFVFTCQLTFRVEAEVKLGLVLKCKTQICKCKHFDNVLFCLVMMRISNFCALHETKLQH